MSIFSIFSPKPTVKHAAPVKKVKQPAAKVDTKKADLQAKSIIHNAQSKAREIILEAKDQAISLKDKARQEVQSLERQVHTQKSQLDTRRHQLDQLQARLEERQNLIKQQQKQTQDNLEKVEKLRQKHIQALEDVSNLTVQEAKEQLLKQVENRSIADAAKIIRSAEEKANEEAEKKAREILVDAMYAGATDYVPEFTVSVIKLPDEETKGRIIGKDGRNIRTFEKVTGVDVDLDEEKVIKLSSFDSVRREVARVALERLIRDGRIHPTHIEEFVERSNRDIERVMYKEGERLCHAVSAFNVPKPLIQLLGRFKYRTSYGQNMIAHTLEETKIGMKLASEVGADVETVKMGCLFHDIGKVVPDQEGSHVDLGVKILKKHAVSPAVIDTVAQHHEDEEFSSVESVLVYIADAISGSRPGARYENYEEYVARLNKLEDIAKKHSAVKEAYAIQAGREIRIILEPEKISDAAMTKLAADIKQEIQSTMTYPGTVKVTLIRETRAQAVAT